MHVADVKVPNEWTTLASLITTVDADTTYVLVNSSPDTLYAVEGDTTPSEAVIGVILIPEDYIVYKKGTQANLYLRNGATPVVMNGVEQIKISNLTVNKVG